MEISDGFISDILQGISEQVSRKKREKTKFFNCIKLSDPFFVEWAGICSKHGIASEQRGAAAKAIKRKLSLGEIKGLTPFLPKEAVPTSEIKYDGKIYRLGAAYVDEERHLWYTVDLKKLKLDIEKSDNG